VGEPLAVAPGVVVPASAIAFHAVRASGPGGQNVNKVASKVELRVELGAIEGLNDGARRRLLRLAAPRLDAEGRLVVTSQRHRDQPRNLEDARERVADLVRRALVAPKRRRPTRATPGSREARLRAKRHAAEKKAARRAGPED
jgi:ribosome-associated protein